MGLIKNWKLRTKLLVLIGFMIAAMAIVGTYNIQSITTVASGGQAIYQVNLTGVQKALEAKAAFLNLSTAVYQHITATNPENMAEFEEIIHTNHEKVITRLKTQREVAISEEERKLIDTLIASVDQYAAGLDQLLLLSNNLEKDAALELALSLRQARYDALEGLDQDVQMNLRQAENQNRANQELRSESVLYGIVSTVVVALLSIMLGLYILASIVNPVKEVQQVAEALADGDLGKKLKFSSQDEIGAMAEAINQAIDNLRKLVQRISETSEQVAASSEELSASSEEVGQASQQVADTINQMAKGADEQAKAATTTSETVEDMSASIQQVAASAQKMSEDANEAVETSQQGQNLVTKAISQMKAIDGATKQTAQAVDMLGEMSQQVGQIVEVITGIADQTNLLALNAAIEAARAGEQGRGFAVVAEEVRKLAEQSREAAEQISTLINKTQSETDKAVTTMRQGSQQVSAGIDIVDETGEAFSAIIAAIQTVVNQIHEVSAASQQLSSGSDEVVKAIETIASAAEESAAGAQEISASAEEQNASVEEIAASSESLAEMAQELQKAVRTFKL